MIKCQKDDCGTYFNPETSSADCPHRWTGRSTPLLDELAGKIRRREPIKLESWRPVAQPHTGAVDAAGPADPII